METNKYNLDINKYIEPQATALVGRPNGEKLLQTLRENGIILKEIEEKYDKIVFSIPKRIIIVNKSFFLGLFETRVQELGKKTFLDKYEFNTSDFIKKHFEGKYVDAALLTNSTSEILGLDD